jgi:hypothetical protein
VEQYQPKLGVQPTNEDRRDAIHIAIAPVKASGSLKAGDHVGRMEDGSFSTKAEKKIGIVDPFLPGPVPDGQTFWLLLYPYTITGLRHHWTHDEFKPSSFNQTKET